MTRAVVERLELDQNGNLDEVVTVGCAHLERMDKKKWFLVMTRRDNSQFCVWFSGHITMTEERP